MEPDRSANPKTFVLNCTPSVNQRDDWTYEDALNASVVNVANQCPPSIDLREPWWGISNQGASGAGVSYAAANGILRWHFVKAGWITTAEIPSVQFLWQANKEIQGIHSHPIGFLEIAGIQIKRTLQVVQRFGCVLESELPMTGRQSYMSKGAFYSKAAQLRISSYHNLGLDQDIWCQWLAGIGPILVRISVDESWDQATHTSGELNNYQRDTVRGSHAICIVGYDADHFIVKNSWGAGWGDGGFGYLTFAYARRAVTEAYGVVV